MPTGVPHRFDCTMCRRRPCTELSHSGHGGALQITRCSHRQRRTGRTKPYRGRGTGVLRESHEYECDCGHKGWSRVPGVELLPLIPG